MQNIPKPSVADQFFFADHLCRWFAANKRDLPFRKNKDPYAIWISEIMAQQTQIDTLIPYYLAFTRRFPNAQALAAASEAEVVKAWEGLGYYSRARNLHKAACILCDAYGGQFPRDPKALEKLPGIGPYTAGAIASIAFGVKAPAVDGNVLRVVTRYNDWSDDIAGTPAQKKVTQWVFQTLPENAGTFNEGLMELGALICTPQNPGCLICPLREACGAFLKGHTQNIPVKTKNKRPKRLKMEVGILRTGQQIYLVKRPEKGLLAGMWGFPICRAEAAAGQAIKELLSQSFPALPEPVQIGNAVHVFSHIIWDMTVYLFERAPDLAAEAASGYQDTSIFADARTLKEDLALPVAFSKLLTLIPEKE
jgi:A/G-specific adenine glycosylase